MDDTTELFALGVETETQKTEKQLVEDLQQFIDDHQNLDDELEKLEAGEIINDGIAQLDEQCTHEGEYVGVYGEVYMAYYNHIEETNGVEVVAMSGQKLKSAGFTVQRIKNTDGTPGRALVGHLFESTQDDVPDTDGGLVQTAARYFAFAPYGTIDIESNRVKEESVKRLWAYIPEIMEEIDGALLNAKDQLAALEALRRFSYDTKNIPGNILEELIQYVNSTVAPEKIGALTAEINGVFSVDVSEGAQSIIPLDYNAPGGGKGIVMGSPRYLFLSEYAAFIEGKTCESKEMYWSVGVAIHRAEPRLSGLEGLVIDVMVGDLRNPILVDLTNREAA